MHPIVSRPDRAWIAYLVMGAAGALLGARSLTLAGAHPQDALWFSPWGAVLMAIGIGVWPVARYVTIAHTSFARFLGTSLVVAMVAGGLWVGLGRLVSEVMWDSFTTVAPVLRTFWPALWAAGAVIVLCILFLLYALSASDDGEAAARRALESDIASRAAELRALRAQVNPHFLFNCLNSISSMTGRDPEGARKMCVELAEFFR